jgi:hypothetical protein
MDEEYMAERAKRKAKDGPRHVAHGLARGLGGFGDGLLGGVTGLISAPVKGAKEGGLLGALGGVGKGVVGLVVKPTAGALDLVSTTLEGVSNTATYYDRMAAQTSRVRAPRAFSQDSGLTCYSARESAGLWILSLFADDNETSAGRHPLFFAELAVQLAGSKRRAVLVTAQAFIVVTYEVNERVELLLPEREKFVDVSLLVPLRMISGPSDLQIGIEPVLKIAFKRNKSGAGGSEMATFTGRFSSRGDAILCREVVLRAREARSGKDLRDLRWWVLGRELL